MYEQQIAELNLLRSWASQVGIGSARDHIALAIHAIKEDAKRFEDPTKTCLPSDIRCK